MSDWTPYHRIAAFALIGMLVLVGAHSIRVINGGLYQIEDTAIIQAPATVVWDHIITPEKRYLWEGGVIRVQRMRGNADEAGSTRLLNWRSIKGAEWTAFEETVQVVPGLFFVADQETNELERQIQIRLEPIDACHTRVTYTDVLREKDYDARIIAPLARGPKYDRLETSFKALNRWVAKAAPACAAPA